MGHTNECVMLPITRGCFDNDTSCVGRASFCQTSELKEFCPHTCGQCAARVRHRKETWCRSNSLQLTSKKPGCSCAVLPWAVKSWAMEPQCQCQGMKGFASVVQSCFV